ncbi:MAG: four helix bundle protein [Gemmatimonadales bacterium]|jgi:four helix bundle protein|nr:four helix bundle protein [Gemmatimonadales bacterium]
MQDFRRLAVWQKAHAHVLALYESTSAFPPAERYGLTSQIRRCGSSIPANIAEATGRRVGPDGRRFYEIAAGSAAELEYHLLLARDLGLLSSPDHQRLQSATEEIKRMLSGLIRSQRKREEL